MSFSSNRLRLARKRNRLTSAALARKSGLTPVTISRLERTNNDPGPKTVKALAEALGYPISFFYEEEMEEVEKDQASFRSLKSMTAKDRDASLAAASIAFLISDWVDAHFSLPDVDIPPMGSELSAPSEAAMRLRTHWGLGLRPIGNMIDLLEAKGVRVFSLAENSLRVDAFSCWRGEVPYVFLNTRKSAERSRFDAAHELAHLCLHGRSGARSNTAEAEADAFAASFLMPEKDLRARVLAIRLLKDIIKAKHRWGVSAAAITYRLSKLNLLSEWHARKLFIEISRLGYRTDEPEPMERESSLIWQTVFRELWKDRTTKDDIAKELHIPQQELESLVFGLASPSFDPRSVLEPGTKFAPRLAVDNKNA
tara:strand:+ start:825 stop:1928 length:1104 start_codon:yes stop_codon:yes gene_type:complete